MGVEKGRMSLHLFDLHEVVESSFEHDLLYSRYSFRLGQED